MKIVLSPEAVGDLRTIARWIAADNPQRAESFVNELERACGSLSRRPSRFPVALNLHGEPIRKRVHRDYLIFYRVKAKQVEIVRILHGARDWAALLPGDP
ncbi:MAG TPA: type II toxin-antitoxin system RelE/ParE family toxin [Allosphingosinicella sp.]|nr:type II toxin-antitoxin system RelE/ParE family toxin [Allosphingosinicella sp.]